MDPIELSPILPVNKSPTKSAAAPPKAAATPPKTEAEPPKASGEIETIEEFGTVGTDQAQLELMEVRRNDRAIVKAAARKQRLVQKESDLARQEAEIKRLNEELAKAQADRKQQVDIYKNMVAKQAKDAKEKEAEKDK